MAKTKRKRRALRKPDEINREANGRPSRRKSDIEARDAVAFEEGPSQVVLRARRRHRTPYRDDDAQAYRKKDEKPVTKEQVKTMRLDQRGSVLGRLFADGKISAQELAAGNDYCERYLSYASLNGLPKPTPSAPSYGEVRGGSRPERIRAAIAAKAAHLSDNHVLRTCTAGVIPAIMRSCVRDESAPTYQIKEGLAALVRAGR